jgi:hypothetical protein
MLGRRLADKGGETEEEGVGATAVDGESDPPSLGVGIVPVHDSTEGNCSRCDDGEAGEVPVPRLLLAVKLLGSVGCETGEGQSPRSVLSVLTPEEERASRSQPLSWSCGWCGCAGLRRCCSDEEPEDGGDDCGSAGLRS